MVSCIYLQNNPYVIAANVFFGLLAVFHLAYLGVMFDSSSIQESVSIMTWTTKSKQLK